MKTRTIGQSFRWALEGFAYVLRHEPNMRLHLLAAAAAIAAGFWLRLPTSELALLALSIAGVIGAECANTAVEATVDLLSPDLHPRAKVAKDVAAAGVLVAAISAIAVGALLLGPPLWELLAN